jgi:hypothetical protein
MSRTRLAGLRFGLALAALSLTAQVASAEKEGGSCWHYHDACVGGGRTYLNCPWTEEGGWVMFGVAALQCELQ